MNKDYFTKNEKILWTGSVLIIILSFLCSNSSDFLSLTASLIGVTAIIFGAKGNPLGPFLIIIFSLLYGVISYSTRYYGEMLTYIGMTLPMSVLSLVTWRKNMNGENSSEVAIAETKGKDMKIMVVLAVIVTLLFYPILKYFNTANLIPSTISVTTSFIAAFLSYKRSIYFSLGYAANDFILIILWTMASVQDISYLTVLICFAVFFVNDIYGYISWKKIYEKQNA